MERHLPKHINQKDRNQNVSVQEERRNGRKHN